MSKFLLPLAVALGALVGSAAAQSGDDTKKPAGKVDFAQKVWPILEKNCIECHQAAYVDENGRTKKPKGGVQLDTKDAIVASKKGKLVIAKNGEESLLYVSISLPADDEDRMPPPKQGGPLSKEQIDLIKRWIDDGADFGKWTGAEPKAGDKKGDGDAGTDKKDAEKKGADKKGSDKKNNPKDPQPKGGKQDTSSAPAVVVLDKVLRELEKGVAAVPATTLASFADGPFRVRTIGEDSPLLTVGCAGAADEVDDRALQLLAPIAGHIAELDLGRTRVGDDAGALLAKMPRLLRLDLRQTQIGNRGAAQLAACRELRSLNLFGTKVGDYALAALEQLPELQQLYVWQTEVGASAVVRLREARPGVRVVFAADMPEPMAEAPAARRRR